MTVRVLLASAALAFSSIAPSIAQAAIKHQIHIPRQQLGSALAELAKQTRIQLVYSADLVEGRNTEDLSGSLTPEEALSRLLDETGLRFEFLDRQTVTLLAQEGGGQTPASGREPERSRSDESDAPALEEVIVAPSIRNARSNTAVPVVPSTS